MSNEITFELRPEWFKLISITDEADYLLTIIIHYPKDTLFKTTMLLLF